MTASSESAPQTTTSKESASRGAHDAVWHQLTQALASGRVLDIPCGSGAFTHRLRDADYDVVSADIAPHEAVPEEAFRQANMNERLPFNDGEFDAVVSIEGIEHIERPFDFIRECRRVLKPGGVFIITTPNISSLRSRWRWFLTGFHNKCKYPLDETNPQPRHHITMLSYPQLRYMLHTSDLEIARIATNRVKAISWLYLPWLPVQRLLHSLLMRRGVRGDEHARVMREVSTHMADPALLFGETMIVVAKAV